MGGGGPRLDVYVGSSNEGYEYMRMCIPYLGKMLI